MTIFYWVDKYKFFKVYSIPLKISEQLDQNLVAIFPWSLLSYAGGGIFIYGLLNSKDAIVYFYVASAVILVYILTPFSYYFESLYAKTKVEKFQEAYDKQEFLYEN